MSSGKQHEMSPSMQRTLSTVLLCTAVLGAAACQSQSQPGQQEQSSTSGGEFQYGALGAHRTMKDAREHRRAQQRAAQTQEQTQEQGQDQTESADE